MRKTKKQKLATGLISLTLAIFIIILTSITNSTYAKVNPLRLNTDNRIAVVAFNKNQVVPVYGSAFITTQIVFGDDEIIQNIQNGDLGAWSVSLSKSLSNMLFLKPTVDNSNTNLTVVTNHHSYYFNLIAEPKKSNNSNNSDYLNKNKITYSLKFIYPEEQKRKLEQSLLDTQAQQKALLSAFSQPENYNWGYSFHGDKSILPMHVFDDGKFTYFQLKPNQVIPAVFMVDNSKGMEALVNIQTKKDYLIAHRVSPQWVLRSGSNHVAVIFNDKKISQIKNSGAI
jgi:type IV secretion system protein VirB9